MNVKEKISTFEFIRRHSIPVVNKPNSAPDGTPDSFIDISKTDPSFSIPNTISVTMIPKTTTISCRSKEII